MSGRIAEASTAIAAQAHLCEQFLSGEFAREQWSSGGRTVPDATGLALDIVRMGEPVYVGPEPTELIHRASLSIPDWPLAAHDLLVPCGFVWLRPAGREQDYMVLRTLDGKEHAFTFLRGLSFQTVNIGGAPGLTIFAWISDGPSSSPRPGLMWQWLFGESREAALRRLEALDYNNPQAAALETWFRFLAALCAFVRQRVAFRERSPGNRAARRLAERAGLPEREVQIILLRRTEARRSEDNGGSIDWSCRWWVSGHWRQQPCGEGRAERRPAWIAPYIKGPDDKSVKPTARRLFAVVR